MMLSTELGKISEENPGVENTDPMQKNLAASKIKKWTDDKHFHI